VFSCLAPTCGSRNLTRTFGLAGWVSQASLRDTASELFKSYNGEVLYFKWTKELTKQLQTQRPDWSEHIRCFKGVDKWLELAIKFSWLPSEARMPLVPSGVPIHPLIDFISSKLNKAVDLHLERDVWAETALKIQEVISILLKEYWRWFDAKGGNRKTPTLFVTPELYTMAQFVTITLEDEPRNVVVSLGHHTDAIRGDKALAELGPSSSPGDVNPQSESSFVAMPIVIAPLAIPSPTIRTEVPTLTMPSVAVSNTSGKAKKTRVKLLSKSSEPPKVCDVRTRYRSLPQPAIHEAHRVGLSPAQIKKRGTTAYTNCYICLSRFDQTDKRRGGACQHWWETAILVALMYPSCDGTLLTYPVLDDSSDSVNYWLPFIRQVCLIPN